MSLLHSVATVGSYTAVSRVFGFVRDVLTAAILGAGPITDAFFVAQRLPNLFRSLFAEGAFSVAFVPLFAGTMAEHGKEQARIFAEDALAVLTAALLGFVLLSEILMPVVMDVIAPGFREEPEKFELAVDLSRITFPYLLFISLVALQGGVLNSVERFAAAAATPILLNLFLIVALATLAMPGSSNFVGEFLILVGTFQVHRLAAVLASSGIIFAAVYLLWMYQRVCFGEVTSEANRRLTDLTPREWAVLLPVLLFIVWIGVYPTTFTTMTEPSVQALITQVQTKAQATSARLMSPHVPVTR